MKLDSEKKRFLLIPLLMLITVGCSSPAYIDQNRQLVLAGRSGQAINNYTRLIEENRSNADLYYQLALILSGQKKYQRALETVSQSIELKPSVAKYRKLAGRTLLGLGQYFRASNLLSGSLALARNDPETHYLLAKAYMGLGKNAEALTHLNRSLIQKPKYFDSQLLWIKIELLQGKNDGDLGYLIALLEDSLKTNTESVDGILLLSQIYQVRGDSFKAKNVLKQWSADRGWNEAVQYELALLNSTQQRWREVIDLLGTKEIKQFKTKILLSKARYYNDKSKSSLEAYKSLLKKDSQSVESLVNRAELLVNEGLSGQAERIYQKLIAQSSKELRAYQGLADIRYLQGDIVGALKIIETALAVSPLDPISQNRYMGLLFENDEWSKLEDYFSTLTFNPGSAKHLYFKGLLLKYNQQYEEAKKMFSEAALLESDPALEIQLADIAIKEKRYREAKGYLDKLERKNHGLMRSKLVRAKLLLIQKDESASIRLLTPYLNKKVQNGKFHLILADAYLLKGEKSKALRVLERGLRMWSFHLDLVDKYTLVLGGMKRYSSAIEILEKMEKTPPKYALLFKRRLALLYLQSGKKELLDELLLRRYQ